MKEKGNEREGERGENIESMKKRMEEKSNEREGEGERGGDRKHFQKCA